MLLNAELTKAMEDSTESITFNLDSTLVNLIPFISAVE
jgi:hypothetical protein